MIRARLFAILVITTFGASIAAEQLLARVSGTGVGAVRGTFQEPDAPPAESAPANEKPDAPQEEGKAEQEPAGQDGEADLEKAIELKAKAQTTRELDEVVDLCETALAKGLDESSKQLAQTMIKTTLFDHAKQLSDRIFEGPRDSRWRFLRREAISRLEKVVELDPQSVEAYLMMARLALLPGGDTTQARQALDKAVEFSANDKSALSEALLLRSTLAEDEESQLADLNQAIIIDPANAKALLARGQFHHFHEDYDASATDFRAAIEQGLDDPAVLGMLIESLVDGEQFDEAATEIEKALAKDANQPAYYRLRAQVYIAQKKIDEALADIEKVLELDPKNAEALMLKTSVLYDEQRYDEAMAAVEKVLEDQPGLIRGILMRSLIHAGREEFDKAIEDVQQLVDFAPDNEGFQLQLALFYNAAKKSADAIKIYDNILEDDPQNANAIRGRGDANLSLGEHAKAIEDYERAIEIQKDDPEAGTINNLAWVLATSPQKELRDGKRSIELGLQACELVEYKESYAVSTLAAGYAEVGEWEKACEWAAKAVELGEQEKSDSLDNLKRELEGYQRKKPWRELLSENLAGPEGEETVIENAEQKPNDAAPEQAAPSSQSKPEDAPADEDKSPDDSKDGSKDGTFDSSSR